MSVRCCANLLACVRWKNSGAAWTPVAPAWSRCGNHVLAAIFFGNAVCDENRSFSSHFLRAGWRRLFPGAPAASSLILTCHFGHGWCESSWRILRSFSSFEARPMPGSMGPAKRKSGCGSASTSTKTPRKGASAASLSTAASASETPSADELSMPHIKIFNGWWWEPPCSLRDFFCCTCRASAPPAWTGRSGWTSSSRWTSTSSTRGRRRRGAVGNQSACGPCSVQPGRSSCANSWYGWKGSFLPSRTCHGLRSFVL